MTSVISVNYSDNSLRPPQKNIAPRSEPNCSQARHTIDPVGHPSSDPNLVIPAPYFFMYFGATLLWGNLFKSAPPSLSPNSALINEKTRQFADTRSKHSKCEISCESTNTSQQTCPVTLSLYSEYKLPSLDQTTGVKMVRQLYSRLCSSSTPEFSFLNL
jgi:hypothetical protein